jgi:hypothetical protein
MNRHEEVFDYGTPRAGWAVKIVFRDKPQANFETGGILRLSSFWIVAGRNNSC